MDSGVKKTPGEWSEDVTQQRRDGTTALLEQLRHVPFACFALPASQRGPGSRSSSIFCVGRSQLTLT